MNRIDD